MNVISRLLPPLVPHPNIPYTAPEAQPYLLTVTSCIPLLLNWLPPFLLPPRYRAGEARFNSDLITTLGIIHEHVMLEATNAKHRVNVSFSPR